jgi:CRP-like cAMP-binding protein
MIDRTAEIRSTRAPKLREDQIEVLSHYGQTRETEAGEVLIRAGDASSDFIVVLEGEVELVDDFAGERRTMGVMRPGPFRGRPDPAYRTGSIPIVVVREGGKVLAIPREQLKEVVTEEPSLSTSSSSLHGEAFAHNEDGIGLRIIGSRHSRMRHA